MKLHSDTCESVHEGESASHAAPDANPNHRLTLTSCTLNPGRLEAAERLRNGSSDQSGLENLTAHWDESRAGPDGATGASEDDSRSGSSDDEDDLTPEIQQAYRIFQSFLSEKHKSVTAPFWRPVGPGDHAEMCFRKMDDKFVNREYESITAFVADFRLMLENCYRFHGVDHWVSKQAQKLEIILEQKLTLLSRTLREKTTLAVTSGGRFGAEDEKAPVGSSSRRRSAPRSLTSVTAGGSESIMLQALRLEELQRAKEEKRQREQERKEAEEASAKEVEEWERSLLSLAEPWPVRTMWELPAIGHFLCLAQTALNLPEIVFYELELCLLMPRCSSFLARIMTSLLCHPHKRAAVHRRPPLPYRKWEAELRRRVQGWYRAVGRVEEQAARAERLGLCRQFFCTLGAVSPLEETPFHLLPFNQRVWLLKGLCDHVYETQKDVQDAVLGQSIHECRESILGYDGRENAYIHFPHFCGADLRIYCQSPCGAVEFPLPLLHVKRSEEEPEEETYEVKVEDETSSRTELNAWDVKEDSLADGEDLDQKSLSGVPSWCREDSLDSGSVRGRLTEDGLLKEEEEDESDCEPCFRVGDSCYKGVSPALNTHRSPKSDANHMSGEDQSPCPDCSGASQESPRLCSLCRVWTEPIRLRRDDSRSTRAQKKKKKWKFGMKKTKTSKLILKSRTAKSSLQRAASNIRKKDKRKRHKLGRRFDGKVMLVRRPSGSAPLLAEPTFQLVCSSLDDLRVLISKTEDQLDELDGKKRSGRWPHKRAAVKELHITLIRLLNELLPWEPKLVKAFQRNRARLKKECDEFRKHPEYENFIREQMDTTDTGEVACKDGLLSAETTSELEESEVKMGKTLKEDSETTENVNHESRCLVDRPDVVMHSSESGPFTRSSKRRQTGAISEELSPCKRGKIDPESSLTSDFNVEVASREQATANSQASVLPETMSSFQGTCKPIQALLAKSVGNKVTLISHPKAAVMAQILRDHNKTTSVTLPPARLSTTCLPTPLSEPVSTETLTTATTSTTESTGQVVYKTAGGVGLLRKGNTSVKFSVQPISDQKSGEKVMQQVVILPSNLLIQSTENKTAQTSVSVPKTTTYLSSVSGFTIPENKVPVQPVAPLKDTSSVRTPSAVVTPSLRTLTTVGVPKKTTEPKSASSGPTKSDAKQELRTVCIRDSQSILVTTRGGNTGVVKVQTSESGTGALPPSPVFNISPQLQAFLVSKASTSTTQAVSATLAAKSLPTVTPQSLSKDPVSSPTCVAGTVTPKTLNQISNNGTTGKTTIPGKSALLATSKGNDSVLITVKDVQGAQQNMVSKCGMKPPQKRPLPGSTIPDQSTFQKVFLVTSSPNIPSKITTTTATCTVPGSRVMFISNSALTIPKEASASEVNISSTSTPPLKVIPNLGTTLSCTSSGTSIQSIGVPGLTSRILGTNKKPEASTKNTPVIVSRVPAPSTTSGLQIGAKSCLVANRSLSGNTESALKVSGTADGKTLTFSTLGTGHMASSALLSVVKPDVPSALNALHCKPGLSAGSSTSNTSSSYSGSLITKHTTLPITVTANKPVITSLCTSHSLIKTTANTSASAVSSTFALSWSSTLTPPVVMTSGVRPLTSTTKTVQEKIVINTTAPLAPGAQLLINNSRFVVPSQGLAPGSHVLLISNSCSGGLQGPSPVGPGGLQGPSPVGPGGLQGPSPVGPGGLQGPSPVGPGGLQGPSPVGPGGLQGPSPVGPGGLQGPSPVGPGGLQGPSPVGPGGLQGPSPVGPGGLQGPSPVGPGGLQGPSPVGPGGLQGPSPVGPGGLQGPSPVGPGGLQGPSPVGPGGLQGPSPVGPGGLQGPSPVGPGGLQGPSPVGPGGLQGPSPASTVPRGPNSSAPHTVPSVVQGVRLVTPVRLPSPKVGPSDRVHQQPSTRTPLNVSGPTALSQVAQALRPGVSSDIVRLPIFQTSKVSVTASQGMTRCPKETSLSQEGLLSTASPMLLQGRPSQTQVAPVVPPVKAAIPRHSPLVTVPPISRMQKLPVATVPPIGGAASVSLATPIATIPPSMSTVMMTPCPPIRAVQPGTIGKPVILPQPQQGQRTVPAQVPTPAKLLLSPDGAILNIVQASATSVQVLAKPMAAQVISSSSSNFTVPILNTNDPLRKLDTLGRPNH